MRALTRTLTLKQAPKYFEEVKSKIKGFEIRKNDRGYRVGDILELKKFDKEHGYLRSFKALTLNKGTIGVDIYHEECDEAEADTIKVKVKEVVTADELNFGDWDDDTLEKMQAFSWPKVMEVMVDFFDTDTLPADYVLLDIEVV